ncbi:MAG: hypothetical protein NXI20_22405 [bacterium]|nr:hypothetical protein [bacterium]
MRLLGKVIVMLFIPFSIQAQSADEILANYFENTGGLDKWKSLKSMKIAGKFPTPQGDFTFIIYRKSPNLFKMEIDVMGTKIIPTSYDGEIAWSLNPYGGTTSPEKMPEEQGIEVEDQAEFEDKFIDYKKKGHQVMLEGTEKVDGVECFKLKLIKNRFNEKDEVIEYHYFDTQNFVLIMQKTFARSGPQKGVSQETHLSDYQELDNGLIIPFYTATKQDGQVVQEVFIEKVEVNIELSNEIFEFY